MEYILSIGDITLNGDFNVITGVKIDIHEEDNNAAERSDWLYNSVVVEGVLGQYSQIETQKIFEWSKKTKKDDVYKTVEIIVKNQAVRVRKYTIPMMFCDSYEENFNECTNPEGKHLSFGSWKLVLKQQHQKQYIEQIKVEC